jgi:hypothetical protein
VALLLTLNRNRPSPGSHHLGLGRVHNHRFHKNCIILKPAADRQRILSFGCGDCPFEGVDHIGDLLRLAAESEAAVVGAGMARPTFMFPTKLRRASRTTIAI